MNFIGKDQLEQWGKEASDEFLSEQTPLNDSIEKIAHEYSLNGEQIKRVCEFANISTNLSLFKEAEDKRFEFDQACHQTILGGMGGSGEKTASVGNPNEYDFPMDLKFGFDGVEPDLTALGVVEVGPDGEFDKTATPSGSPLDKYAGMHPNEILCAIEQKQEAIRELAYERDKVAHCLDVVRDELVNDFKQRILDGEASFSKIAAAGASLFGEDPYIQKAAAEELIKIGFELHKQGAVDRGELTKLAYAAPSEWIAESFDMPGTPVLVQNGRKTSWAMLDTLVRQRDRPAEYDKPLLLLNDDVRYLKQVLAPGEDLDLR